MSVGAELPARPPIDELVTFVFAADLEAGHRFYHDALGMEMVLDQGVCRIYRATATSYIGLCDHQAPDPGGTILTVVSDDVDGWHARLDAAGVTTDGPPRLNERFGIYHFFAVDPDGHAVEFQRFGTDWPGPLP